MNARLALTAALLATASCVPSIDHLVASRRYADAVCHARSQDEAARVAAAVERDAEQRVHAHAVHDEELTRALGERGAEIASRLDFIRLHTVANRLPARSSARASIELGEPAPSVVPAGGWHAYAPPAGPDAFIDLSGGYSPGDEQGAFLFALTGERLPGPVTRVNEHRVLRELGWAVVTLGLKQLLFGADKVTETQAPGRDEYLRAGPLAMALFDGLNQPSGVSAFALPDARAADTRLVTTLLISEHDEDHQECLLLLRHDRPLGRRGASLQAAVDERFRGGALPVAAPDARRSFSLSNQRGRWSSGR